MINKWIKIVLKIIVHVCMTFARMHGVFGAVSSFSLNIETVSDSTFFL